MKRLFIIGVISILLISCDEEIQSFNLVEDSTVYAPNADFYVTNYFMREGEVCEFKVIFPVTGKWQVKPENPSESNIEMWQKISSKSLIYDWVSLTDKKDSITGKSVYYNILFTSGTTYQFRYDDNNVNWTHQQVYFYKKNLDAPKYGILNQQDSLVVPKIKFDLGN